MAVVEPYDRLRSLRLAVPCYLLTLVIHNHAVASSNHHTGFATVAALERSLSLFVLWHDCR